MTKEAFHLLLLICGGILGVTLGYVCDFLGVYNYFKITIFCFLVGCLLPFFLMWKNK